MNTPRGLSCQKWRTRSDFLTFGAGWGYWVALSLVGLFATVCVL